MDEVTHHDMKSTMPHILEFNLSGIHDDVKKISIHQLVTS